MSRNVRRGGQIWVRIFPDKPITVRPTETRMGSGKKLHRSRNMKKYICLDTFSMDKDLIDRGSTKDRTNDDKNGNKTMFNV
ncbi:unnamed protein product [Lupinus luteus]|uniref:50S ribosomal protein L16, chloroplastic n=1 Tax=Lupinus luteus TaxID=3873 RepID=A0AAV1W7Z2_LUPLU